MTSLKTAVACAAAGAAFAMTPAWAETFSANGPGGAHYANGEAEPLCTPTSPPGMSCTDTIIGGVGHTDAALHFTVTYSATVTCTNKGGNTVAVKTQFPQSSNLTLRASAKNGQLAVPAVASTMPANIDFEAMAVCPNPNWKKHMVPDSAAVEGYLYTLTFVGFANPYIELP